MSRKWRRKLRAMVPRIRELRAIERLYPGHRLMPGYHGDYVVDAKGHTIPLRKWDALCWGLLLNGMERRQRARRWREMKVRYGVKGEW